MSWSDCGTDDAGRPIGYGHAATCDQEGCDVPIDRGLAYCCGNMHGGGAHGCGGYFCPVHLRVAKHADGSLQGVCPECLESGVWDDEDEGPCPDGQHKWVGRRMGGSPDTAEAAERVAYCDRCGVEKTDD